MRKTNTVIFLLMFAALCACQSASDADRPLTKEGNCLARELESGTCVADE